MCPNAYKTADIVTFNDKILNRKFHFLCSHFVLNLQCLAIGCTSQPTVVNKPQPQVKTSEFKADLTESRRTFKKQLFIPQVSVNSFMAQVTVERVFLDPFRVVSFFFFFFYNVWVIGQAMCQTLL